MNRLVHAFTMLCFTGICLSVSHTLASQSAAKPAQTIEIVASDQMKYSVTQITAKPGERLHIQLKATGTLPKAAMAHNFVLLKPGTDTTAFTTAAVMARTTDYVPASRKADVLAASSLVGNGETAELDITVPTAPGSYPFLCTFPGHFAAGMKGILLVK